MAALLSRCQGGLKMIKGQRAVLINKETDYKEYGEYVTTTYDNHIIQVETGSAKFYPIRDWECEEDKA